ncbi:MAG: hypothetical protein QXO70_01015 [Candidatus Pacearchaeota archaeon]
MKTKKMKEKLKEQAKFTKFELVEKILSEEEKIKDEAQELEKSKKFTGSKKFKKINELIEELIFEIDNLPIEARAKMLELILSYALMSIKLPLYLKDFILKKITEDKLRTLDMGLINEFFENLEKKKNNKEYIG